jgi:diguanylate cyclase (GGDEF)-like protein
MPFIGEYRVGQPNGSYRWLRGHAVARLDENGVIFRWYGTSEDIHDHKIAQEQLHWAAYHDDLTGLPNRRRFSERLQHVLQHGADGHRGIGLLIMDLDHLKLINDRFGHDAGDSVLQEFAKRLVATVPDADTVARLGGDEFAVILADVSSEDELAAVARAVLHRMRHPLPEDNAAFDCRTSIGAAFTLAGHATAKNLQKQADLALYRCKATGRGAFRMFHAAMSEDSQKEASALDLAGKAVASDWVIPFYQPKVALVSGEVVGFEALLRLEHPDIGTQYPDTISPAFEDTELGTALGQRMRMGVFRDMRSWLDAGVRFGRVAINASAAEFRHDDYAERVLGELQSWDLPTTCLEIEVTESVFLGRHVDNVERALRTLSAAGVTIALDDFGTGYASLTHLKRFRVDTIKIDRSFVQDIETDAGDAAIVKALLSLGESLRITVVAEGVETETQDAFLQRNGCDLVQGYLYGRPAPGRKVLESMGTLVRT